MRHHAQENVEAGKECVWDYPRPPRLEPTSKHLRVELGGVTLAETRSGFRVLETSHPPVYYIPPGDVAMEHLVAEPGSSWCEWKGRAAYYSVALGDLRRDKVAWSYPQPTPAFEPIRDYIAFYAHPMDGCFVDGERVESQPGDFYGGWITRDLVGPFKGGPGSRGW
jgi:uncharacterized protein (DUF427 family)